MSENKRVHIDVVVAGDVSIDWNIAHIRNVLSAVQAGREEEDEAWACSCCGGSMLIGTIVQAVADSFDRSGDPAVHVERTPEVDDICPEDPSYRHYYQTWREFPKTDGDTAPSVWRVEDFLGASPMRQCTPQDGTGCRPSRPGVRTWAGGRQCSRRTGDLVILNDDAGTTREQAHGGASEGDEPAAFRFDRERWPLALTKPGRDPWVIVKMRPPIAEGLLWRHIYQHLARKSIVVMDIRDLRHTSAQVSQKLSWERSVEDLTWELLHNPRLNTLSRAAHVVVSFGPSGVYLMSDADDAPPDPHVIRKACRLFFDPSVVEGEWEQRHTGKMLAKTTVLVAAIAQEVMRAPARPDVPEAIFDGLAGMRTLYRVGYKRTEHDGRLRLGFPLDAVVQTLKAPSRAGLHAVDVPIPKRNPHSGIGTGESPFTTWTVLGAARIGRVSQLAEQIVRRGAQSAIEEVPLGRFGKLVTCDRQEIENLRSIRTLIEEYCNRTTDTLPLNIAVFGPPGAGKSFGVEQVAKSLGGDIKEHSFDLSQFSSADALVEALHQVRDWTIGGKIPLVFWDEFDAKLAGQSLGWLRYFLSPMQNGTFQDGQLTHPIGRAIFVFVGGRSHRREAFVRDLQGTESVDAKKPDFVSRLRGYVDVLGPNRARDQDDNAIPGDDYMVRRALLLRSMLHRHQPHIFRKEDGDEVLEIDDGVLRAFLGTPEYKHGARSMEAIIKMSALTDKARFEQSCLPSEQQLNLHVDGPEFNRLVGRAALFEDKSEMITRACHSLYVQALEARGFRRGDYDDDGERVSSTLKPYAELSPDQKEVSRRIALDALDKFNELGYMVTRSADHEPPLDLQGDALEQVARVTRRGVADARRQLVAEAGKGPVSAFVEWEQATDEERAIDSKVAKQIPVLLAQGGFTLRLVEESRVDGRLSEQPTRLAG